MQSVVAHVQENDVVNPTIILLEERNRQKNINPNARWYERETGARVGSCTTMAQLGAFSACPPMNPMCASVGAQNFVSFHASLSSACFVFPPTIL